MFFKKDNNKTEVDFLIKICALLVHAAKIDENYTENEEEIIKKTLLELGAYQEDLLRIIKKKWRPNRISFKTSAKADEILKNAQVFKNLEDAINDLQFVFATSNRKRDLNTDLVNLKQGTKIINSYKNG